MHEIIFQKKGLSLEKLNLLCKIARSGGIRAAVGDDPSAQSLASRQMKELSEYVGIPLFKHVGRTLELTEQGRRLQRISEDFLGSLENYIKNMRNVPNSFKLGVGDAIFQWYVLPQMRELYNSCNIDLLPTSLPTSDIVNKVAHRELDAGLVRLFPFVNDEMHIEVIGELRYRLFVPRQFLPSNDCRNPPPLKDLPFCTLTGHGLYAQAVSTLLASAGTQPQLACSSTTQIYGAVQSGQFAAILPERAHEGFSSDIKSFQKTELAAFTRKIALIYLESAQRTEQHLATLNFLRKILKPD